MKKTKGFSLFMIALIVTSFLLPASVFAEEKPEKTIVEILDVDWVSITRIDVLLAQGLYPEFPKNHIGDGICEVWASIVTEERGFKEGELDRNGNNFSMVVALATEEELYDLIPTLLKFRELVFWQQETFLSVVDGKATSIELNWSKEPKLIATQKVLLPEGEWKEVSFFEGRDVTRPELTLLTQAMPSEEAVTVDEVNVAFRGAGEAVWMIWYRMLPDEKVAVPTGIKSDHNVAKEYIVQVGKADGSFFSRKRVVVYDDYEKTFVIEIPIR